MKTGYLTVTVLVVAAVFFSSSVYADDLSRYIFISDAWVQAMPPIQKTTAAYMVIRNNAPKEVILQSASSDIAGATEIHQMSAMNGMMNMAMVTDVHIPAQGKVILQPGGFHIMLINLKKPVNKGDSIPLTLHFQGGSNVSVNVLVKLSEKEDNGDHPPAKPTQSSNASAMAGMKM